MNEDENGHALDQDGELIYDPRCYFCLNSTDRQVAWVKVEIGGWWVVRGTHVYFPSGTAGALNDRSGHLLSAAPPRPRWMEDRTDLPCQQPHPDAAWFAPDKDEVGAESETATAYRVGLRDRAVQLCGGCPMELDCREHGLRYHHFGIWGGVRLEPLQGADKRRLLEALDRERRRRSA